MSNKTTALSDFKEINVKVKPPAEFYDYPVI
jgi:hypothetical protein